MNFDLDSDQQMLQQSARKFLQGGFSIRDNLTMAEKHGTCSDLKWEEMARMGWMGIPFPEELGGAGFGLFELCLMLEEMGREVMVGPYFATVVLGGLSLWVAATHEQKLHWIPKITDGSHKATLAYYNERGLPPQAAVSVRAVPVDGGYSLSGTALFVLAADVADLIIVPAWIAGGSETEVSLFVVETKAPGILRRKLPTLDVTRPVSEVRLENAMVTSNQLLGERGRGLEYLNKITDFAIAGLCAEMVGGSRWVTDSSVSYAKERVQFGRPIGSFQAIKHKCSDMHLRSVTAEATSRYLMWTADAVFKGQEAPLPFTASVAKVYCQDAYAKNAAATIQIHGGNGFSWDYGLHLHLRRSKACESVFGDAAFHHDRLLGLAARPSENQHD